MPPENTQYLKKLDYFLFLFVFVCFCFFEGGIRTGFFGPEKNRLIAFKKVCDIAIIYSSEKSQHLVSRSGFSELQDFRREVMAWIASFRSGILSRFLFFCVANLRELSNSYFFWNQRKNRGFCWFQGEYQLLILANLLELSTEFEGNS